MRRFFLVLVILAAVLAFFPASAVAQGGAVEVSTEQLQEEWEEYDGREIILRGEAVGDVMVRGEYAWITVNDDRYSREALHETGALDGQNTGIGVWLPANEAEKIEILGRYGKMGDFVEVRGVFYADDEEHGGDFDIHAHSLEVLIPGRTVDTSPDSWKYLIFAAALLFLIASMTPLLQRRAREMKRARALLEKEEE